MLKVLIEKAYVKILKIVVIFDENIISILVDKIIYFKKLLKYTCLHNKNNYDNCIRLRLLENDLVFKMTV